LNLIKIELTVGRNHGDDLQTDVLFHLEVQLPEAGDDFGDLLHHVAHVLVQLVHRDRLAHHLRQTGLQGYEIRRNLSVE